jgi:hypothetical protein
LLLTNSRANSPASSSGAGEAREGGSQPISRVLSWATIHLGYASPRTSSSLPGGTCGPHARREAACPPIWPCSRRGLPCRRVLPPTRCALTAPFHPCRPLLAKGRRRSALCCTFRGLTPPRHYLAPRPLEPGLSSMPTREGGHRGCLADSRRAWWAQTAGSASDRCGIRGSFPRAAISAAAARARRAPNAFHR